MFNRDLYLCILFYIMARNIQNAINIYYYKLIYKLIFFNLDVCFLLYFNVMSSE